VRWRCCARRRKHRPLLVRPRTRASTPKRASESTRQLPRRLGLDPTDGHIYLFMNKRRRIAKATWFDDSGWCYLAMRLERVFGVRRLTVQKLRSWLMDRPSRPYLPGSTSQLRVAVGTERIDESQHEGGSTAILSCDLLTSWSTSRLCNARMLKHESKFPRWPVSSRWRSSRYQLSRDEPPSAACSAGKPCG
jgi:hypothetical protein